MNHSACHQLTSNTLQSDLDTHHNSFPKISQLIDFITPKKSMHWKIYDYIQSHHDMCNISCEM